MKKSIESECLSSEEMNKKYWDEFYKKVNIQEESTFCKLIKTMINKNTVILDVGCGSGRDAFSFTKDGFDVVGIDRSEQAIKLNKYLREDLNGNASKVEFFEVNISDKQALSEIIESLSRRAQYENKKLVVYVRFLLHSINEITEEILLTTVSKYLQKGDYFAAEFRTIEDKKREKIYDDHYRRFIVAEDLLSDLENTYNFSKILFTKGTGLSVFNSEDPYIGRIVMEKN